MRCSCRPKGRVRGHAGTSGWNGLGGSGCGEEPLLPFWQLERSLIIAALTTMSNCKENCLANLLESSAGGRSWLWEAKCLPELACGCGATSPQFQLQGCLLPVKDGEGKVRAMEPGEGWAGRWDSHAEEQQEQPAPAWQGRDGQGCGRCPSASPSCAVKVRGSAGEGEAAAAPRE